MNFYLGLIILIIYKKKVTKIITMSKRIRKFITFKIAEKILNTIIKSIIDYGCMFYINTSYKNIQKIEKLYYHCAIICTNAYKNTSRINLLKEINWDTCIERSHYLGLLMFAKIKLTKIPKIIYEAFPFSSTIRHSDRFKNNLPSLVAKRNHYCNSYCVKIFREWNKLSNEIKKIQNIEDFRVLIENNNFQEENSHTYDSYIHTVFLSFRMKNSLLQADKYKMNYSNSNNCNYCNIKVPETLYHVLHLH